MSNPIRSMVATVGLSLLCFVSASAQAARPAPPATVPPTPVSSKPASPTDRERDGLQGPVRRIKTEVAKLNTNAGRPVEGPRVMLESAAYDLAGAKVDTAYYPVEGEALTGRETYKYDDQGNISEMTLLNPDGSVRAKETYRYEYDFVGNWTTMTTSVAVIEGGKLVFDPTEITRRTISYYMDERLTRLMEASQRPAVAANSTPAPTNQTNPVVPNSTAPKPAPSSGNPPDSANATNAAANHVVENRQPEPKPGDVTGPSGATVANPNPGTPPANSGAANGTAAVTRPDPAPVPPAADPNAANRPTAPRPITKPVSGGVLNGSAISLPAPRYPDIAKRTRATGMVVVEVVIDEDGKVISAKATSGPSMFFSEAIEAAKRARFSPTKLSGIPVKVTGVIKYNFSLGD